MQWQRMWSWKACSCFSLVSLGALVGTTNVGAVLSLQLAASPSSVTNVYIPAQQSKAAPPIRPHLNCPVELEDLVPLLLRDLPAYANRVNQRSLGSSRTRTPGYILLAGRPEFEPLSLGPGQYHSTAAEGDPRQVFFTTLDRQYVQDQTIDLQHYHWLFLTYTESGWRLALLFSSLGSYASNQPPSPPQDSSQGVIAQAIRLWLRDCQAGALEPL